MIHPDTFVLQRLYRAKSSPTFVFSSLVFRKEFITADSLKIIMSDRVLSMNYFGSQLRMLVQKLHYFC